MDTLRSNGGSYDSFAADADDRLFGDTHDLDEPREAPPPAIGTNERRMQVRAYNFWASHLADHNLPSITELKPDEVEDFGINSVLLDFTAGSENPRITFLGENLAQECDIDGKDIDYLSDVPARSLLSRITDHYMQIIANQAPIGFEAEFVNQREVTILYRGILLPYSSDGDAIDYIYGVINWKELADQAAADELLLEIEDALDPAPAPRKRAERTPLADWADGPGAGFGGVAADAEFAEYEMLDEPALDGVDPALTMQSEPLSANDDALQLADWLARAREQADTARDREDRTRNALYEAIGRAWDFALAAQLAQDDFAELLDDAGLKVQDRAPMTPVVKLVFGVDYDKTRLTEYASALNHAQRLGLPQGALADHLRMADGGLKGVVTAERKLRREEAGKPPREPRHGPRKAIAKKLRKLDSLSLGELAHAGEEFALVMVRRDASGELVVLGEVPNDASLVEKAARSLLG